MPRGRAGSGVRGVDYGFVWWSPSSGPTAVTFLLLDADVVLRLVAGGAEVGEHIRPQTLALRCDEAWEVIARLDLAVTSLKVAVVESFALGKGQLIPLLNQVTQAGVYLPLIYTPCDEILVLVDLQLDPAQAL